MLKSYYKSEEYALADSLNKIEIKALKGVVTAQTKVVAYKQTIIAKQDTIITLQKDSINRLVEVIDSQNKDIRKERSKTFIVSVAGISSFLFMTYLWLGQVIKN